jgi:hypothetical protein
MRKGDCIVHCYHPDNEYKIVDELNAGDKFQDIVLKFDSFIISRNNDLFVLPKKNSIFWEVTKIFLTAEESEKFVEILLNPREPNERLKKLLEKK